MTESMMSNLVWTLSIAALLLCVACLVLVYSVWVLLNKETKPGTVAAEEGEAEDVTTPVVAVSTNPWLAELVQHP